MKIDIYNKLYHSIYYILSNVFGIKEIKQNPKSKSLWDLAEDILRILDGLIKRKYISLYITSKIFWEINFFLHITNMNRHQIITYIC